MNLKKKNANVLYIKNANGNFVQTYNLSSTEWIFIGLSLLVRRFF